MKAAGLTTLSDFRRAERARTGVFASVGPLRAPLKAHLEECAILSPFLFDPAPDGEPSGELVALAGVLRERSEDGFFLSFTVTMPPDLP